MQGGQFGAMERIHNLVTWAKDPMDKMKVISHISLLFDVKHMLFFFFFFFSSERSAKQFRQIGPNCKGKHTERSRNVAFTAVFF